MALRFLGEESDLVPRERVLASLRLLLDEPKLADLVIADLARWEDWSAVDRLVAIFKDAKADNIFVREPIVNYLRACPLPEAAEAVAELEKIDPEAVRRAATLAGLAGIPSAATTPDSGEPAATDSPLATSIEAVQGDEDPTAEPPPPQAAPASNPSPGAPRRGWQWAIWAAIVIAIAAIARATLKPVSGPR
jgi:FAD/FMN-containing dehydrogenase